LWVVVILAGLVVLFILVLCVPIDTVLSLNTSDSPRFRIRLIWLFGIIGKDIGRKTKKPKKKAKPEEKPEKRPEKKGRVRFSTILRVLRTKGLLRQIKVLVKGILRQFKLRELVVNLRLGLDDPADTGLAFAFAGATMPVINLIPRCRIDIVPYFHDEFVFEGHLYGTVRLQPVSLVWPVCRFAFSLAVLRVVKILVLSKWRKKK